MMHWFFNDFLKKQYYWLLVFISLLLLFGYLMWTKSGNLFVNNADLVFHFSVAEGYIRANGPVTWNFWEALPDGRANNYPPIFHIILATMLQLGLGADDVLKMITLITIIGGTIFFWEGLRRLFDWKVASFSVITVLLSFKFMLFSILVQPATLVLWFTPWVLILFQNKRLYNLCALLIILLYLHMIMPYFIISGLIIYAYFYQRKDLVKLLIAIFVAFLFYLPWLAQIILHWKSIKYLSSSIEVFSPALKVWSFDLIFWSLFVFGIIMLIKNKQILKSEYFYFILIAFLILPVSYFFPVRALNGHSFLLASPIVGLILYKLSEYWFGAITLIVFVIFFIGSPHVRISNEGGWEVAFNHSSIRQILQYQQVEDHFSFGNQVKKIIQQNSNPGESIAVIANQFNGYSLDIKSQIHVANYFASVSSRPVLNMRQPELFTREMPNFTKAKILITSVPLEEIDTQYVLYPDFIKKPEIKINLLSSFNLIRSVDLQSNNKIYLYKNSSNDIYTESINKPIISLNIAQILIVLLTILAVTPIKKT